MGHLDIFKEELENPHTQYFILDSKGNGEHEDVDFKKYSWDQSKNNRVKEGDLFIYRRPKNSSETNQFYFYGAAKINSIVGRGKVFAEIDKSYPFQERLFQSEVESFQWDSKKKRKDWSNFFDQYGMNRINQSDFIGLLEFTRKSNVRVNYDLEAAKEAIQRMQVQDYHVEDSYISTKGRTKQNVFADQVKTNYQMRCAICGISTKGFLIGSHIIPWSERKDIRLDPSNGISLCVLHDKAFDQGLLTITDEFRMKVSGLVRKDSILAKSLLPLEGKKIKLPKIDKPKLEYLKYHRERVFKQ